MTYLWRLNPKWLVFLPVLAILLIAVACGGEDATPAPTATPQSVLSAAEISALVAQAVAEASAGQQQPLTASEIEAIVANATAGQQDPLTASEIEAIVANATAGQQDPLTASEIEAIVANATAGQQDPLTASEVEAIVRAAIPPTAAPTPTTAPPAAMVPVGVINYGEKELGAYSGHPRLTSFPQLAIIQLGAYEWLISRDNEMNFVPILAKEWSVSPDNLTWTFKLEKGVQFHKGYGEMTANDWIYSIEQAGAEGSTHGVSGTIRRIFLCDECWMRAGDDHTLQVHTGTIGVWDMFFYLMGPSGAQVWVVSKAQVDDVGEEEASRNAAGTGPWEIVESSSDRWELRAVQNHWRKTPNFDELVFHEIPEESTRVANFAAGQIDTFPMAPDSIAAIERVDGVKFMAQQGAVESRMGFYGSFYVGIGTEDERPGYNPDLPWVSSNPDVNSPEWDRARKVRLAMATSIDREKIVNELLKGNATTGVMWGWFGWDHLMDPDMVWDFDPDGARQLLADAGYPEGFKLDLWPAIRGVPAEVEGCEAVANMWRDIGLDVNFRKEPFGNLVQLQFSRSYEGITCHNSNPLFEPLTVLKNVFNTKGGWNAGAEHPFLDEATDRANELFNSAERYAVTREIGRWMFDNVMDIGLYNLDIVWPIGPKLEVWDEHLRTADTRRLSGLEFVEHRK